MRCLTSMRRMLALCLMLAITACATTVARDPAPAERKLLIFSKTTGFRHKSIPQGIADLTLLATRKGYAVTASEDPDIFSAEKLGQFRAIILLSNTTDSKDPASDYIAGDRLAALRLWSENGGAIVGIHAATDSHFHTPWYAAMIGGQFKRHPRGLFNGAVTVLGRNHPALRRLPAKFVRADEWYELLAPPANAEILMTLDPGSIGEPGPARPVTWTTRIGKGRNFITVMGHTPESYSEPLFLHLVEGGLEWAVGERR